MKQVLITGASSDIGLALCRLYLEQKFRIVAHYNKGRSEFTELVESSDGVTPIILDLSNPGDLEQSIADHRELFADTDVLINAAALLEPAPFCKITAQSVIDAISVNVVPGLLLMQAIAPEMVKRKWGRIVNLSSIGVKFGGGSSSFCYALSKHAMEFLPSDHKAWAADNVFVNSLRLGVTDTRIHGNDPNKDINKRVSLIPAGRMATPEEMAKAVYWYGSNENTFTTGQTITIAGGE